MSTKSSGSITYTYSDEANQVDYEISIGYTAYPEEKRTWDYPGAPSYVEWEWRLVEIVGWSCDSSQPVGETSHRDIKAWLATVLESSPVKDAIDERCFEDANERHESALDSYYEEKFESWRLSRR